MEEGDNGFDIEELERQHSATYLFKSRIKTFVLKALTQDKFNFRVAEMAATHPEFRVLFERMEYLQSISTYPDGLKAEEAAELAKLVHALADWSEWFMLDCFVDPVLTHPKQLSAISSEIGDKDWGQLYEMLGTLSNPMPASDRDKRLAAIYLKYGVPIAPDLTADNLTVQQAGVIDEVRAEEQAKAEQLIQEMTKGQ